MTKRPALERLLARLSRRTSTGRYIPEIDGLRFLCIMLVLLFHVRVVLGFLEPAAGVAGFRSTGFLDGILNRSQFGVELFFMISGFVLALPFLAHRFEQGPKPSLRRYYLRRVTRLEPPYVLTLSLFFLLAPLIHPGATYGALAPHLATGLAYLNGVLFRDLNPINAPAWSLEVEVQFYILVPLLAMLFGAADARLRRLRIVNVALAGFALQTLLTRRFGVPNLTLFSFFQYFMVGFILADMYVTSWRSAPAPDRRWDLVTLVGWPALFALASWNVPQVVALAFPGVAGAVLWAGFRGPLTRRLLTNRWIATIGGMCYSIYLIHYPLMIVLSRWAHPLMGSSFVLNLLVLSVLLIPVVITVSAVFFAAVERPCMDPEWPRRVTTRLRHLRRRAGRYGDGGVGVGVGTNTYPSAS